MTVCAIFKPQRKNGNTKGGVTMDIELYQLIQQVAEIARQAAIDKAAADVVKLEAIGE